jgi:serine protease Do
MSSKTATTFSSRSPTARPPIRRRSWAAIHKTDLAVLKIAATDLPALRLADSDQLEVGDVVIAIGNPFNVGQTVTTGIISGLGRGDLPFGRVADYEDFIQTDAAINVGNSGGPLLDAEGRLIGINTFIMSNAAGGNQGMGFAIPVNLARHVLERLVADGRVRRGYLGVMLQPVDPEAARDLKLPDTTGALVTSVQPGTPAARAGLRQGDVITTLNGTARRGQPHFPPHRFANGTRHGRHGEGDASG